MSALPNSREDELKRKRRSLLGKIERRRTAILFAERDMRNYRAEISMIERELEEYRPVKSEPRS